jgi:hypothetical protein
MWCAVGELARLLGRETLVQLKPLLRKCRCADRQVIDFPPKERPRRSPQSNDMQPDGGGTIVGRDYARPKRRRPRFADCEFDSSSPSAS